MPLRRRALTALLAAVAVLATLLAATPAAGAAPDGPAQTTLTVTPAAPGPYPEGSHVTFTVAVTSDTPGNVRGALWAERGSAVYFADGEVEFGAATLSLAAPPAGTHSLRFRFEPQGLDQTMWLPSETTVVITTGAPSTEFTSRLTRPDVYVVYDGPTAAVLERFRCGGELYTGPVDIFINGEPNGSENMIGGDALVGGLYPVGGADPVTAVQTVTGVASGCPPSERDIAIGTFTVHSRRPTLTATVRGPGPHPAGSRVVIDVTATNTGPALTTGSVRASAPGGAGYLGDRDLHGGVTTITIEELPAGTTELTVHFEDHTTPLTWWPTSTTLSITAVEAPTVTVNSTPASPATGTTQVVEIGVSSAGSPLDDEYLDGMQLNLDGAPFTFSTQTRDYTSTTTGFHRVWVDLMGVAPGTRTFTATFPASGAFTEASVTWDMEVRAQAGAISAAGPTSATWGDTIDVEATIYGAGSMPIDGTIEVRDGATVVGSTPAAAGPVTVEVDTTYATTTGARTFSVHHVGSTFYEPSATTLTVGVNSAPWNLSVDVGQLTAGVLTTLTYTATPPTGDPVGFAFLTINGVFMDGFDVSERSSGTVTVVPTAGAMIARVEYVRYSWGHFAPTVIAETFTFTPAATTTVADLTYTAPAAADSTGTLSGDICVNPTGPAVMGFVFDGTDVELTLTNHDTGAHSAVTVPLAEIPGCGFGYALNDADLAPGEYTVDAAFPGNEFLAASANSYDFTVAAAPTELGLTTVGAAGEVAGLTTQLRATLSAPVPGHSHTAEVTFYVNGEPVGTTAPVGGIAELLVRLPTGAVEVSAHYPGDAMHALTTSTPLFFNVAQRTATVEVTVTPERVRLGETSTLTARVTVNDPRPGRQRCTPGPRRPRSRPWRAQQAPRRRAPSPST